MLFGHQVNDTTQTDTTVAPSVDTPPLNPLAVDPATGVSLPADPLAQTSASDTPTNLSPTDTEDALESAPTALDSATPPSSPVLDNPLADETTSDPQTEIPSKADSNDLLATHDITPDTDLLSLKQQALGELTPLVSHLEQTPEEKFRTTMMMIQSTDNQALIKEAYAAAQAIPDDKARAQALLDVINEINYFTQQKD